MVLRYVADTEGSPCQPNPNGSANAHRRHLNAAGNVLGIMPHPERAVEPCSASTDGRGFFTLHGCVAAAALHRRCQPMSTDEAQPQRRRILRPAERRAARKQREEADSGRPEAERKIALHEVPEGRRRPRQQRVPRRPDRDLSSLRRHVARRGRAGRRSPTRQRPALMTRVLSERFRSFRGSERKPGPGK